MIFIVLIFVLSSILEDLHYTIGTKLIKVNNSLNGLLRLENKYGNIFGWDFFEQSGIMNENSSNFYSLFNHNYNSFTEIHPYNLQDRANLIKYLEEIVNCSL